jgi:hypothetical protein
MVSCKGAVRPDQLDRYLDEFTFRFTRRSSRSRGLLFYRLLEQAALTSAAPYRFIVGANPDFNIVWLVELNGYPLRPIIRKRIASEGEAPKPS